MTYVRNSFFSWLVLGRVIKHSHVVHYYCDPFVYTLIKQIDAQNGVYSNVCAASMTISVPLICFASGDERK